MPTKHFDLTAALRSYLSKGLSPEERAHAKTHVARVELPRAVERAGWRFLRGGEEHLSASSSDRALVLGIAPWSDEEWHLLAALHRARGSQAPIRVFDIDDCAQRGVLDHYVPGVPTPLATPVIAEYQGTMLLHHAEGHEARQRILDMARLGESEQP